MHAAGHSLVAARDCGTLAFCDTSLGLGGVDEGGTSLFPEPGPSRSGKGRCWCLEGSYSTVPQVPNH